MTKETDKGYLEEVKIDKYDLDNEWLGQAAKFIYWGEQESNAEYEKDRIKEKVDLTRAELSTQIREDPKKFGLEKVTEGAINEIILQNKKFQEVNGDYIEAVKTAKILTIAKKGFEQRKTALEELVKLYLNGYWSDPKSKIGRDFDSSAVKGAIENKLSDTMRKRKRIGE